MSQNAGHFQIRGKPEFIGSRVGLVPTNAPAVTNQSLEGSTKTYRELGWMFGLAEGASHEWTVERDCKQPGSAK